MDCIWVNLKHVGSPFFKFMSLYIKISFTQRKNNSQLIGLGSSEIVCKPFQISLQGYKLTKLHELGCRELPFDCVYQAGNLAYAGILSIIWPNDERVHQKNNKLGSLLPHQQEVMVSKARGDSVPLTSTSNSTLACCKNEMPQADCDLMRNWVSSYGAAVRQQTVREETTMAKHDNLPESIYQRGRSGRC